MNAAELNRVQVELHMHTHASKDSLVKVEKLLVHCDRIGIDKIAITDHNVIEGALEAQSLAPGRVIVGEEIATTQGELIGYFLSDWIPPNLEPMDAIERLQDQGAVISVAHPFDSTRKRHWSQRELEAIAPYLDAIETFNARCLSNAPNLSACSFARDHNLLETVGSDAHSLWEVGRASLRMPDFHDAGSFRAALHHAEQDTRLSPPFVHLFSRFALIKMKLLKTT